MTYVMEWRPLQGEPSPEVMRLLRLADEGDERIRAVIANPEHETYLEKTKSDEQIIGVLTMRWAIPESEIIYLAVAPELQGRGVGKGLVIDAIMQAKRRQVPRLIVGTGNSSLENLAFYQHCGFRMDHIRRDYYDYIQPPISENRIPLRDMLVFSMDVESYLQSIKARGSASNRCTS